VPEGRCGNDLYAPNDGLGRVKARCGLQPWSHVVKRADHGGLGWHRARPGRKPLATRSPSSRHSHACSATSSCALCVPCKPSRGADCPCPPTRCVKKSSQSSPACLERIRRQASLPTLLGCLGLIIALLGTASLRQDFCGVLYGGIVDMHWLESSHNRRTPQAG
jgi:hypothetical protein